jgi:hypothetical protein
MPLEDYPDRVSDNPLTCFYYNTLQRRMMGRSRWHDACVTLD